MLEGALTARVDGRGNAYCIRATCSRSRAAPCTRCGMQRGRPRQATGGALRRPGAERSSGSRTSTRCAESGRVGRDGVPGPLTLGAYLTEYRDVFRLCRPAARARGPLLKGASARLAG